jgi:serine/threonine protein kinase
MSAKYRAETVAPIDETIVHEPAPIDDDPTPRSQRYVFSSGARPLEGYTIKRAIGRGGFGEVYYALSDAGKEVALKLITRNLDVERRGVEQCMNLKNHHLITIYDMKPNDEGDSFVIMEYIAGPSLAHILQQHPRGMPLNDVRSWMKGLIEGVAYLHDRGIVHRDLKPANLFLEDGVVKIGDYGLSKAITNSREPEHSQSVGTCHYMAPEISKGKYNTSVDIYAIGIILYEMITGRVPFDGRSVGEVISRHLFDRPDLSPLPEPFKSLIAKALEKDPVRRPQRVASLYLPGDAPKQPDVRIIGDGKNAPVDSRPGAVNNDVVVIKEEESVMYIGPDTVPPRPARQARLASWPFGRTPARPPARPRPARARSAPPQPAPEPPPPEPPPLPSPRLRVAELAGSMLTAVPIAGIASFASMPLASAIVHRDPEPLQFGMLFAMMLLGSWAVLVPTKFWEARTDHAIGRRLVMLAAGLGVGGLIQFLMSWSHVVELPSAAGESMGLVSSAGFEGSGEGGSPLASYAYVAGFFGLALASLRWWNLTSRSRKARFRLVPILVTAVVVGILGGFLPTYQPWSGLALVGVALVTQVVSPWNRDAARAAAYASRRRSAA